MALSRIQAGNERFIPYKEVKEVLTDLLIDFGPKRKSYHPEEPFVRLQRDGIWELSKEVDRSNPSNKLLFENSICGGFTEEVVNVLAVNPELVQEIAILFWKIISLKHFMKIF